MEFFKSGTNIDFLGLRKWAAIFSIIVIVISLASLIRHGLDFGLDFTGGTQIQLRFKQPVNLNTIRAELNSKGFKSAQVQSYGDSHNVLVTLAVKQKKTEAVNEDEKKEQEKLTKAVLKALPGAEVNSVDYIGAKVSSELAYKGVLAVVVALLVTMIYIAFRFEFRLAISSVAALIHDPILILGIFSFFHISFDLTALAAILTVIGYSLNDTIVVFDRIRENFRKMRRSSTREIVNTSINETLSRTIMTSGLTFIVVAALVFLGGPSIHAFALALLIGIFIGTYSSIYVAGSLAVTLGLSKVDLLPVTKRSHDSTP